MSGWFAMNRAMFEHPIFEGKAERVGVWAWLIATAAWKERKMDANGKIVVVKRGQILTSYRQISKATGASLQTVRTLIEKLRGEHAIDTETNTGRLLVTIRNYDKYQSPPKTANTPANTAATHEQHTNKQRNNIPVGAIDKSSPPDPKKIVFDSGVELLGASGFSEQRARPILGKWVKRYGEAVVIDALGKAKREGAIDPVSFCEGVFRHVAKSQDVGQNWWIQ